MDDAGNIILTGTFNGTVDFDPGPGIFNLTSSSIDFFVLKLNGNGDFVWAKKFGGSSWDYAHDICLDPANNIYITGDFNDIVNFNPGSTGATLTSNGSGDSFTMKLTPTGDFIWVKSSGGTQLDHGRSIIVDYLGNVITTGTFKSTVDFDPGSGVDSKSSNGAIDVYIQKLDSNGNYLWTNTFGGTANDSPNGLTIDTLNNIYHSGGFAGTVDFDPSPSNSILTSAGLRDGFVQKLNSNGDHIWAKRMGSTGADTYRDLDLELNDHLILIGTFKYLVDFDTGIGVDTISSEGSLDIFIQKLDLNGAYIWTERVGGISNERAVSISVKQNNVLITGVIKGTIDFDFTTGVDTLSTSGLDDCFTLKISRDTLVIYDTITACNAFTWIDSNTYTSSQASLQYSSTSGRPTQYHLNLTIDSNYTLTGTDVILNCGDFTWIDGITYTQNNNTAMHTLTSIYGCDSIVSLNLIILSNDTVTEIISVCNQQYLWPANGQSYAASNIDTAYLTNQTGCDSILILNLTIGSNQQITESISVCQNYTWPTNGITYTQSTIETLFFTNQIGCDSTLILELTIHHNDTISEAVTACHTYLWPANGLNYTQTTIDTAYLNNQNGCDSIAILNLSITANDLTITRNGYNLIATLSGAQYQWVDCNDNYAIIPGAINQSYTATQDGNYAVILSQR